MREFDWKIWSLVFVLTVGGMLELFKHFPGHTQNLEWDLPTLNVFAGADRPYNVKDGEHRPQSAGAPRKFGKLAGAAMKPASAELNAFIAANAQHATEFGGKDKAAEGAADKAKKKDGDDEYEVVIDPATGKMYRKKKKKKDGEIKPDAPTEPVVVEPTKPEEPKHAQDVDSALNDAIAGQPAVPAAEKKTDPYADLNEWISRLLSYPDVDATKSFISQYESNLVSADIFYKITQMMIEDSRPDMKKLGVLCAGSARSVLSFQILAEVVKTTSGADDLGRYARAFIQDYASLGNLYILERILRAPSSSYTTVLATQMVDQAATHYLAVDQTPKPPTTTPGTTSTTTTTATAAAAASAKRNAGYFTGFVAVLQSLLSSPDQTVADDSRATLTNLQSLLAATGTATVTRPPPPGPSASNDE